MIDSKGEKELKEYEEELFNSPLPYTMCDWKGLAMKLGDGKFNPLKDEISNLSSQQFGEFSYNRSHVPNCCNSSVDMFDIDSNYGDDDTRTCWIWRTNDQPNLHLQLICATKEPKVRKNLTQSNSVWRCISFDRILRLFIFALMEFILVIC